ncbi:MAG: hypothetical protein CMJ78_04425 [Planctomycetaceae bacterium]|nr:hypothetical protein [Planctomycetaceae bacterium]
MDDNRNPLRRRVFLLLRIMLPVWAVLLGAFALPRFELDGRVATVAYWLSASGGRLGLPVMVFLILPVVIGRPGLTGNRRRRETRTIVGILLLILGATAFINERITKPAFAHPRPNIVELAEIGVLDMPAKDFYETQTKHERRQYLSSVLTKDFQHFPMSDRVRVEWAYETGFSFPSGHAFASMLFATFCVAMGMNYTTGPRRLVLYSLAGWAILVCYSRPVMRVHTPTDINCGGLLGVFMGTIAFVAVHRFLCKPEEEPPAV